MHALRGLRSRGVALVALGPVSPGEGISEPSRQRGGRYAQTTSVPAKAAQKSPEIGPISAIWQRRSQFAHFGSLASGSGSRSLDHRHRPDERNATRLSEYRCCLPALRHFLDGTRVRWL